MKCRSVLIVTLVASLVLSGCMAVTEEQKAKVGQVLGAVVGGVAASQIGGSDNKAVRMAAILAGAFVGAYIGEQFAKALSKKDQEKLFVAQQQAAGSGKTQTFTGENGVVGRVSVVSDQPIKQEQKVVQVKVLKDKVAQTPPLKLVGAPYSARKVINVRSGPGLDYKPVSKLTGGESVQVIGEALPDKKWYLISQLPDGTANGYVYSSLMSPTSSPVDYVQTSSGTVSEVNVQASAICKTVRQEVTTADGDITEDIRVCQQGNGTWKLA